MSYMSSLGLEVFAIILQDGYGESKETSVSPEAVHALLGRELTTEQRLKLSSTAIDAVIKGRGRAVSTYSYRR